MGQSDVRCQLFSCDFDTYLMYKSSIYGILKQIGCQTVLFPCKPKQLTSLLNYQYSTYCPLTELFLVLTFFLYRLISHCDHHHHKKLGICNKWNTLFVPHCLNQCVKLVLRGHVTRNTTKGYDVVDVYYLASSLNAARRLT